MNKKEELNWINERIEWCDKMIAYYGEQIRYYKNLKINDEEYKEEQIKYNQKMRNRIYKLRKNWREQKEMIKELY
jgi:hypothetical protein